MRMTVNERLHKLWVDIKGPDIHPDVKEIIKSVEHHAYVLSLIHDRYDQWKEKAAKETARLGNRFVGKDTSVYPGRSDEQLFPLTEEMLYTLRTEFCLPFKADRTVSKDELILNRGIAALHIKYIKDVDNPDPLDLKLLDGIDPYFEIKVNKDKQKNWRDDLTITMNSYKLRNMLRKSPNVKLYMKKRGYPHVSEGKVVTIPYILEGIPGREKEIPPVPYNSQ